MCTNVYTVSRIQPTSYLSVCCYSFGFLWKLATPFQPLVNHHKRWYTPQTNPNIILSWLYNSVPSISHECSQWISQVTIFKQLLNHHQPCLQCQVPASPILAERAAAHDAQLAAHAAQRLQKSPTVLPAAAACAGSQAGCGEVGQGFALGQGIKRA